MFHPYTYHLQGEHIIGGIRKDGYTVIIGEDFCSNTVVMFNLIVCEPPKKRPQVQPEDDVGYNKIPVKVVCAFL